MAQSEARKRWRENNRERENARRREYWKQFPEKRAEEHRAYRVKNYEKQWYARVKQRSLKQEIPFDLTLDDFVIPEVCPVFGTPIIRNDPDKINSPSMDRLKPELGYIKGNVRVISYRANQVKSNSTIEEMEKVLNWFKKEST